MKFKPGDKGYLYSHGIVVLASYDCPDFPLKPLVRGSCSHSLDGKVLPTDKYPSLITLEEAEKRGFVRKKVKPHKGLRVRYYDTNAKEYGIAYALYGSVSDFEHKNHHDCLFFSFVDDQLRDCPPPQDTIEWEETV